MSLPLQCSRCHEWLEDPADRRNAVHVGTCPITEPPSGAELHDLFDNEEEEDA